MKRSLAIYMQHRDCTKYVTPKLTLKAFLQGFAILCAAAVAVDVLVEGGHSVNENNLRFLFNGPAKDGLREILKRFDDLL